MNLKMINAIMMIVSTSVGMGILGLPIVTYSSGFIPTIFSFVLAWVFMTLAAFYILDVKMSVRGHYSLASMIKLTLGKPGHYFASTIILLLLYALLSTYLMAAVAWLKLLVPSLGDYSECIIALFFTLFFVMIMICSERWLYNINNLLGMGVLLAFVVMISSSLSPSQPHFLQQVHVREILPALPLLLTTFGFSIVVPAITEYLSYDKKLTKKAIVFGSLISLLAYVVWEWVALGNIPLQGDNSFHALKQLGDNGTGVIVALATLARHPWVIFFGKLFAFLLVITSFLGISLALLHFLSDLLHVSLVGSRRFILATCMYIPPVVVIIFFPRAFVQFLSFAGIFVAILLGLFPALMICKLHHKSNKKPRVTQHWFVVGLVCVFFSFVILQEIMNLTQ